MEEWHAPNTTNKRTAYLAFEWLKWPLNGINGILKAYFNGLRLYRYYTGLIVYRYFTGGVPVL